MGNKKLKITARIISIVLFFSSILFAQSKPDLIIFDEDDPAGTGYYDASWGNVTAPSVLTLGGGGDKLSIETIHRYTGSHSGILQWTSVSGGTWKLFVASPNWTGRNAGGYDSIVFYINAPAAISASALPKLGLESTANKLSALIALGDVLASGVDADTTSWQRVSIPLTAFEPYNEFDLALFKDFNFHQNAADNISHTLWFDNVRIVSTDPGSNDSTKPGRPAKIVGRAGAIKERLAGLLVTGITPAVDAQPGVVVIAEGVLIELWRIKGGLVGNHIPLHGYVAQRPAGKVFRQHRRGECRAAHNLGRARRDGHLIFGRAIGGDGKLGIGDAA